MLTQKGTQRIEVIVRKEGGGYSGINETSAEEANKENYERNMRIFGSNNPRRIHRIIKTNVTHALAISKQITDLSISYFVGGVGVNFGDQALQDNISRQFEQVKDVTGFASSVAMGAVYGAWGGPIGAVLGATFGAVQNGASLAIKYANRERDFSYKVFKENNSIEYQRARASINLTTGRLR